MGSDSESRQPRRAPKANKKRKSNNSKSKQETDIINDNQLLLEKPPISTSRSALNDTSHPSENENEKSNRKSLVRKPRNPRSRSSSRERLAGNVNEAYESDSSTKTKETGQKKQEEKASQSDSGSGKKDKLKRKRKKQDKSNTIIIRCLAPCLSESDQT